MNKVLVVIAALLISGCAPYMEANYISNWQRYGGDDIALFEAGFERKVNQVTISYCSYYHMSNPSRGFPFNDKRDHILVDGVGCGIRVGGIR